MPPKKHAPQPKEDDENSMLPPRLTPHDIQADWDDTSAGEYFCRVIINRVVADMEDEIVRAHMDHTAVPWTVQSVLTDLMESLQLNFIERETGQVDEADPADVEISIEEPPVTDPDSWARASILQRTPLVRADSEQFASKVVVGKERRTPKQGAAAAAAGEPSSPLAVTGGGSTPLIGILPGGFPSTIRSSTNSNTSPTNAAGNDRTQNGRRRGTVSQRGSIPSETDAYDVLLRSEEEVKQMERQQAATNRMVYLRSVSDRLNKQFSEIKNVNQASIVVDGKTNSVIQVSRPDPRKMPATAEPKVKLEIDPEEAAEAAAIAAEELEKQNQSRGRTSTSASLRGPLDKKSTKPKKPDSGNFFVPEQQGNPMVQGVQPAAGVQSKEGDAIKRTEYKPQKSKISRMEFTKVMTMQQQAVRMAGSQGLGYEAEMGTLEGIGESAPMAQPGLKRTTSVMVSPIPTSAVAPSKTVAKSALKSNSTKALLASSPTPTTSGGQKKPVLTRPATTDAQLRVAQQQHTARSRSPMSRREGDIPITLPLNNPPERLRTPSNGARINPTQIPRPNDGHAPLRDITMKARASTPDMVKQKEMMIQHRNQPSVMRVAMQEGGEPGEVSDVAAEFFSELIPDTSSIQ